VNDAALHTEFRAALRRARALCIAAGANITLIDVLITVIVEAVAHLHFVVAAAARVGLALAWRPMV
jgi:hypothetical protein